MSWHFAVAGLDKEKIKAAVRAEQRSDEKTHGIPEHIVSRICAEVEAVKVYEWNGIKWGVKVETNGSWHDQGGNETISVGPMRVVV